MWPVHECILSIIYTNHNPPRILSSSGGYPLTSSFVRDIRVWFHTPRNMLRKLHLAIIVFRFKLRTLPVYKAHRIILASLIFQTPTSCNVCRNNHEFEPLIEPTFSVLSYAISDFRTALMLFFFFCGTNRQKSPYIGKQLVTVNLAKFTILQTTTFRVTIIRFGNYLFINLYILFLTFSKLLLSVENFKIRMTEFFRNMVDSIEQKNFRENFER